MRIALALAIVALPVLGASVVAHAADTGEDRYGPPPVRRAPVSYPTPAQAARDEAETAAQASSYNGPYLHWSSKSGSRAAAPATQAAPPRPAAMAPASNPAPRYAPAPSPVRAYAPAPAAQPAQQPQALPNSLYGQGAPMPAAPPAQRPQYQASAQPAPQPPVLPRRAEMQPAEALPPPRPQATASAAPVQAPAAPSTQMREPWRNLHAVASTTAPPPVAAQTTPHAPTQVASNQPAPTQPAARTPAVQTPAATTQVATAETPSAPVRARFYSLHRDYGDAPDPVALPPARPMVLIGPNQLATAPTGPVGSGGAGDADGALGEGGQAQSASAQAAANAVKPKASTTGTVY